MSFKRKIIQILSFFLNFFVLTLNIFFYSKRGKEPDIVFNNPDSYIFNSTKLSSQKNIFKIMSLRKKKISIFCEDTLNNSIYIGLYKSMIDNNNLIIEVKDDHPDFLIYDVFGCEHLNEKYNDSVKIAYYSENILPDFSQADYSLSQAHIIYLDRYFK